jgi:hypothetical protein
VRERRRARAGDTADDRARKERRDDDRTEARRSGRRRGKEWADGRGGYILLVDLVHLGQRRQEHVNRGTRAACARMSAL